jgi:chromosome segregation ATPase
MLATSKDENMNLVCKLQALQKKYDDTVVSHDELTMNLHSQQREEREQHTKTVTSFEDKQRTMQLQVSQHAIAVASFDLEKERHTKVVSDLEEKQDKLQNQLDENIKSLAQMEKIATSAQAELEQERESGTTLLASLRVECADAQAKTKEVSELLKTKQNACVEVVGSHKKEVQSLEAVLEKMRTAVESSESSRVCLQKEVCALKGEITRLQTAAQAANHAKHDMEKNFEEAIRKIASPMKRQQNLATRLSTEVQYLEKEVSDSSKIKMQNFELEKYAHAKEHELKAVRRSLDEQITANEKNVAALSAAKFEHGEERRLKQAALNDCQRKDLEINSLMKSLKTSSTEFSGTTEKFAKAQAELTGAKSELGRLQAEMDECGKRLQTSQRTIDKGLEVITQETALKLEAQNRLETVRRDLGYDLQTSRDKCESLQARVDAMSEMQATGQQTHLQLNKSLQACQTKLVDVEEELTSVKTSNAHIQEALSHKNSECQYLEASLREEQDTHAQLQKQFETTRGACSSEKHLNALKEGEISALKLSLDSQSSMSISLKEDVSRLKVALTKCGQDKDIMEASVDSLTLKLQEKNNEIFEIGTKLHVALEQKGASDQDKVVTQSEHEALLHNLTEQKSKLAMNLTAIKLELTQHKQAWASEKSQFELDAEATQKLLNDQLLRFQRLQTEADSLKSTCASQEVTTTSHYSTILALEKEVRVCQKVEKELREKLRQSQVEHKESQTRHVFERERLMMEVEDVLSRNMLLCREGEFITMELERVTDAIMKVEEDAADSLCAKDSEHQALMQSVVTSLAEKSADLLRRTDESLSMAEEDRQSAECECRSKIRYMHQLHEVQMEELADEVIRVAGEAAEQEMASLMLEHETALALAGKGR